MPHAQIDEAGKKRIEESRSRFQEAMRRIAPYVRRKDVEEPKASDEWRSGEAIGCGDLRPELHRLSKSRAKSHMLGGKHIKDV